MSRLLKIFKKFRRFKRKDFLCFAKKLQEEWNIENMREIYETMRESRDMARKSMKKLLYRMKRTFGEDKTIQIVNLKLEIFQDEKRQKGRQTSGHQPFYAKDPRPWPDL